MMLCIGCYAANAQSSFTQRLQQSKKGEGKVTVTQDKAIEDLVNGPKVITTSQTAPQTKPQTAAQTKPQTAAQTKPQSQPQPQPRQNLQAQQPQQTSQAKQQPKEPKEHVTTNKPDSSKQQQTAVTTSEQYDTTTPPDDGRKKKIKGYKVKGYRVQVYAGGNSRENRVKAESTGREIKALFPETPVYVHFYPPRWICRIGNYRTIEEASEVLRTLKKLGYSSATIVKGKITVPYQSTE